MKKIVLIGSSGHGKVCAEIAELAGYESISFLDDNRNLKVCGKFKIEGTAEDFRNRIDNNTDFFVSIGDAAIRRKLQKKIESAGGNIVTLIHPKAVVSNDSLIGIGSVLMAGAIVNVGCFVGKGCLINTSSSIDHDCNIGDYCHIAVGTHLSGTVEVGSNTWIGAGATVSNNIKICENCMIGAGAVVVEDIKEPGTYIGIPARKKKGT